MILLDILDMGGTIHGREHTSILMEIRMRRIPGVSLLVFGLLLSVPGGVAAAPSLHQLTNGTNLPEGVGGAVTLSADGSVVALTSARDGTTGQGRRVYTIRADGSGLTRYPAPPPAWDGSAGDEPEGIEPSLSSDGRILTYQVQAAASGNSNFNRYAVAVPNQAGTDFNIPFGTFTSDPSVSGDGSLIAFIHAPPGSSSLWVSDPTGLVVARDLADAAAYIIRPRISADGAWVYYLVYGAGLYRTRSDGVGGGEQIAPWHGILADQAVSSNGAKVVFTSTADLVSGNNTDNSRELFLWEEGVGLRQLTHTAVGVSDPSISGDGKVAAFTFACDIFLLDISTGTLTQLTTTPISFCSQQPTLNIDASTVVFQSNGDLTGENGTHATEVFVAASSIPPAPRTPTPVSTPKIMQLTNSTILPEGLGGSATISADGRVIALTSGRDSTTGRGPRVHTIRADGSELKRYPAPPPGWDGSGGDEPEGAVPSLSSNGGILAYQVQAIRSGNGNYNRYAVAVPNQAGTDFNIPFGTFTSDPSVSGDGSLIAFVGASFGIASLWVGDPTGLVVTRQLTEPGIYIARPRISSDGTYVVYIVSGSGLYRTRSDGAGGGGLIAPSDGLFNFDEAVTADGGKVVFTSNGDLVHGNNMDNSRELFLWEDGIGLSQVTQAIAAVSDPSISGDGRTAAFSFDCEIFLVDLTVHRLTQLTITPLPFCSQQPTLAADGRRVLFQSTADLVGANPNHAMELFLVDMPIPAADSDGDGVPDGQDHCTATPQGEVVDAVGCSCSQKSCDDGKPCNGVETCDPQTAACVPGVPPSTPDQDSDGIADECDNCPSVSNVDQADSDGDGKGDACDACPGTPAAAAIDRFGCSCSQKSCDDKNPCNGVESCDEATGSCVSGLPDTSGNCDSDGDGVIDRLDKCPHRFDPKQKDTDRDGVGDVCDNCPKVRNPDQADSDADGIGDACQSAAVPRISKLSPTTGAVASKLTIHGSQFGRVKGSLSNVVINATTTLTSLWSPNTIVAIIPLVPAGQYHVVVTTPAGSSNLAALTVVDSTVAAQVRQRIGTVIKLIQDNVKHATLPSDWGTLLSLAAFHDIDSVESLYVLSMDRDNVAFNEILAARHLLSKGLVDQAEMFVHRAVVDHGRALALSSAAVDKASGRVTDISTVLSNINFAATVIVDCGFAFTPIPWAANIYDWVNTDVEAGAALLEGEAGSDVAKVADALMLQFVVDPVVKEGAGRARVSARLS